MFHEFLGLFGGLRKPVIRPESARASLLLVWLLDGENAMKWPDCVFFWPHKRLPGPLKKQMKNTQMPSNFGFTELSRMLQCRAFLASPRGERVGKISIKQLFQQKMVGEGECRENVCCVYLVFPPAAEALP